MGRGRIRCDIRPMIEPARAALAAAALIASLTPSLSARADPIEDVVRAEMARHQVPGIAISVVRDGRIVRAEGFGQANIEHGVPVHADTLFKMGATGMQITAAAIMLLVEDGKLELDAPVGRYLSRAPGKWRNVTIRHLLEHRSGLPTTPNGDFRTDYSNDQLLDIIARQDVNFAAGTRWRFSYANYIVLGFVIEAVAGEHWSKFFARRVFEPLDMTTARGIDEIAIVRNRAAGYELRGGELRNAEWVSPTANSTADGSLYLSVLDYAAWATALSQKRLIGQGSWNLLSNRVKLPDGAVCSYAPGWYRESVGQVEAWWHSGSWQGFQTYALRYPASDLTVAVFANGAGADPQTVARAIAGLVEPALVRKPAAPLTDNDPAATARVRALVDAIAAGRALRSDFAEFAQLDFDELTAQFAGILKGMGAVQALAPFDRRDTCGETAHRYRARYEQGLVEIRVGLTKDGQVSNLDILPLADWNAPL